MKHTITALTEHWLNMESHWVPSWVPSYFLYM